jgi:nicotinamide mononucleotide transporter
VAGYFDTPTVWVEGLALWASLACVWLARTENIWTMPYGIVSVLLLGWYFLDIGLVGQGWLQYVYYVPIQFAGWWAWARGGPGRTELRVSRLTAAGWGLLLVLAIPAWLALAWLFGELYDDPSYLLWDTSIVAASVVAQTLMTLKKRESWWFWTIPVNISAIALFSRTETWAFVFLYVVFLANSVWGWIQWQRAEAVGASQPAT